VYESDVVEIRDERALAIDRRSTIQVQWAELVAIAFGLCDKGGRCANPFLFWRAWNLRNDIVHGKGTSSILASGKFLTSYWESLNITQLRTQLTLQDKGKTNVATGKNGGKIADIVENRGKPGMPQRWFPPSMGWIKVSTYATFCYDSGAASVGIIIRDSTGKVLLSDWQMLRGCASPEQAEAEACLRGLRLVLEWIREPAWVETDCLTLIKDFEKGFDHAPEWQDFD
jgi:hypothetical protein